MTDHYPIKGWIIDGKCIHPPEAYIGLMPWMNHVMTTLPNIGKKIKEYNEKRYHFSYGKFWKYPEDDLYFQWKDALIRFFNKRTGSFLYNMEQSND